MKTIYVDISTFICYMEAADDRITVRTGVFDGMSDREIEAYRFVPEGYRWTDPDSGESYTGQHVMPINYALGGTLRAIQKRLDEAAEADDEHTEALHDVYAALAELAGLIM